MLKINCVVLAGGMSRRMGTDKSWIDISGLPMIKRVCDIIKPQVNNIIINTNSSDKLYDELGYKVVKDSINDFAGPLAGVLAGMENTNSEIMLSVPVDCPLLPNDLVEFLMEHMDKETYVVVAKSNGRHHPVIALWRTSLASDLKNVLKNNIHKVDDFVENYHNKRVEYNCEDFDVFMNVNTQQDVDAILTYVEQ